MPKLGPLPRFADLHVREALELVHSHGRISRKELGEKLGIGEGSARTIFNRLKMQGLVRSSRGGHALTPKGKRWLGKPLEHVRIDAGDLTVGRFDVAIIVRGASSKVRKGIEQRDEAIKAGAKGATLLVFEKNKFELPRVLRIKVRKSFGEMLIRTFKPSAGDAIVIGSADEVRVAEAGAKAAARTLL